MKEFISEITQFGDAEYDADINFTHVKLIVDDEFEGRIMRAREVKKQLNCEILLEDAQVVYCDEDGNDVDTYYNIGYEQLAVYDTCCYVRVTHGHNCQNYIESQEIEI